MKLEKIVVVLYESPSTYISFLLLNVLFLLSIYSSQSMLDASIFYLNYPTMMFYTIGFSFILFAYPFYSESNDLIDIEWIRFDSNAIKYLQFKKNTLSRLSLIFLLLLIIIVIIFGLFFYIYSYPILVLNSKAIKTIFILITLAYSYQFFLSKMHLLFSIKIHNLNFLKLLMPLVINIIFMVSHNLKNETLDFLLKHFFYVNTTNNLGFNVDFISILQFFIFWFMIHLLLDGLLLLKNMDLKILKSSAQRIYSKLKVNLLMGYPIIISVTLINALINAKLWNDSKLINLSVLLVRTDSVFFYLNHLFLPLMIFWLNTKFILESTDNNKIYSIIRQNKTHMIVEDIILHCFSIFYAYSIYFLLFTVITIMNESQPMDYTFQFKLCLNSMSILISLVILLKMINLYIADLRWLIGGFTFLLFIISQLKLVLINDIFIISIFLIFIYFKLERKEADYGL